MQNNHSPGSQQAGSGAAPIQQVSVDTARRRGDFVSGFALGLAITMSLAAGAMAYIANREARLLGYYVNEVDGKLIHAGFIEPRERWSPSWKPEGERQVLLRDYRKEEKEQ